MFFSLLSLYSFNDWQFTIRSEFAEREQEKKERWKEGRKEGGNERREGERKRERETGGREKTSVMRLGSAASVTGDSQPCLKMPSTQNGRWRGSDPPSPG